METTDKTIVVTGATGVQGRAVTRHLLDAGWRVRALTRHPDGEPARELQRDGARIVRADMNDVSSLVAAAEGAYGLFSVQPTVGSPGTAPDFSAEDEVRWGTNIAEASRAVGLTHLVFSSVAGADRHESETLPENLISKWRIERHLAKLGLPATILRPVSFMENYTGEYALQGGRMVSGIAPDVPLQIVAVDDVGFFTALAFSRPQEWIGRAAALAGDELTPVRIAAHIETAIGRPLPYERIPMEAIRAVDERFAFAHEWLNERGYRADVAATRRIHPAAMDFRTWLERTGAARIAAFLAARQGEAPGA
ncbi:MULTISPECIES: NmrA/HSCARG family protein [unclassified Streptomyces]|uniref:NmrA/HSCARG family protein n=1 Tax=unclassified Streptomyces TaxID=2593676 RepID=UPI00165661DD|nr:NmrA/HSCARG family protein [Streptomyces sp. CB02980]MCB8902350.1 NmrA/HSCARG family protein [Streptomyces sp. CB02980]